MEMVLSTWERAFPWTRNDTPKTPDALSLVQQGQQFGRQIAAKYCNQLPILIRTTENPLRFRSLVKNTLVKTLVKNEEKTLYLAS